MDSLCGFQSDIQFLPYTLIAAGDEKGHPCAYFQINISDMYICRCASVHIWMHECEHWSRLTLPAAVLHFAFVRPCICLLYVVKNNI